MQRDLPRAVQVKAATRYIKQGNDDERGLVVVLGLTATVTDGIAHHSLESISMGF